MEMNRREFLKGLGAVVVLNTIPHGAEAKNDRFNYLSSEMTPTMLEKERRATIESLAQSIPSNPKLNYLRAYIPHLDDEAQMYIPNATELKYVVERGGADLDALGEHIRQGSYGLFVFADARGHERKQRLYVLRRKTEDTLQFVKGYKVSLSHEGFGNELDSNKTPLGFHTIHSGTVGMFGEVVSQKEKRKDSDRFFNRVRINGKDRWFVRSFGRERGNEIAEVVTDQYLLVGPQTSVERGVRMHGTNRSGGLDADGKWVSYLDGESLSSACLRISNTGLRNLHVAGQIENGLPVMIHATSEAQKEADVRAAEAPQEWIPPQEKRDEPDTDGGTRMGEWEPPRQ